MNRMLAVVRRFSSDRRGLAALEFALIAPLMVLVLFGSVEVTELLNTNRRAENASASVADVIARDTDVTTPEISDLWTAAATLMYPNSATPLKMRVTSVRINSATDARVLWSEGYNGYSPRGAGSAVALPSGLMIVGSSVIMSEANYHYVPPIGVFLHVAMDLSHTEYRRPRVADPVTRS